ncbi:MAG: PQQ-binding-like beta-propeller repeat protein [Planctomycetota bacterium]
MKIFRSIIVTCLLFTACAAQANDFPQWRGHNRAGAIKDSVSIAESWTSKGPGMSWESETFPQKCGYGSPVIAGGQAFLYINWRSQTEVPYRRLTKEILRRLRWFDQGEMPAALLAAMEKARAELPPNLLGRALEDRIDTWIEKNLGKNDKRWKSVISKRLKAGPDATPLEVLKKFDAVQDHEFPSQESLDAWFEKNDIPAKLRERTLRAIPTTLDAAQDVLLCVNLKDGKTAWRYSAAGKLEERTGSSTPCVHQGRVYFLGTTHAHCVDQKNGKPLWTTELPDGGGASSFLVTGEKAMVVARHLLAFDKETGEILWQQPGVRSRDSSPASWNHGETSYALVNGDGKRFSCVDTQTGEIAWTARGGGVSSPVVSGDIAVLHTNDDELGLVAYKLSTTGARPLWNIARKSRGAASPIVTGDTIYLFGGDEALCVALRDGSIHWRHSKKVEITSPILADGKIISIASGGRQLWVTRADSGGFQELSSSRLAGTRCSSPALADGHLVLRLADRLASFDLRQSTGN